MTRGSPADKSFRFETLLVKGEIVVPEKQRSFHKKVNCGYSIYHVYESKFRDIYVCVDNEEGETTYLVIMFVRIGKNLNTLYIRNSCFNQRLIQEPR